VAEPTPAPARPDFDLAAICAHPDDAEALAGGTLRLEVERGRRVAIVDLTAGERGSRGTPARRAEEAAEAARILGVAHRECLRLPDAALAVDTPQIDRVVAALRRLRPAIVVTHQPDGRHPDHDAASRLVGRACFLAGLVAYLPGEGTPFRPRRIVRALAVLGHDATPPTFVVDISAQWETKMRAVRAYASQFQPPPGTAHGFLDDALANIELSARWHGRSIGVAYGEGFVTREPPALTGLLPFAATHG
jgi:bacillithiol biosynthesis deacetylase BshB1